jgi:DNA gyrase subunit A
MDVARDDMDLLVMTEAGYGKRTRIDEYRKTSRGAKGVLTIKLTEAKGGLAGALVVRPHQELVFISQNGMIQRTGVKGISQQGRSATGVRVMNPRDGDQVSAVALIVESEDDSGGTTLDVSGEPVVLDGSGAVGDELIDVLDDEELEADDVSEMEEPGAED